MKPLLYKPDLEDAAKRLEAWWENELVDRVCLQITSPRADATPEPNLPPRDLEQRWLDIDFALQSLERHMRRTYFGGEALPIFMGNVGPDAFSAFLGAEVGLLPDTTWVRPLISDWEKVPSLEFNKDNAWWQLQYNLLRRGQELGVGRWLVGFPDSHTGPDALSALRGRSALCLDFYDNPQQVKDAMLPIRSAGRKAYDAYFSLLQPEVQGSSSGWCTAWGKGRCNVDQCDFMALISPQTFQTFFDDWLQEELAWFDRIVWHLDGPECLPHLDYLLSQPKIKAIQWVPGSGMPPQSQWIPLLKRIQAAGKGLWLGVEAWEVEILTRELASPGLMLITSASSQAEADKMLRNVANWTHT
jgi:hypothetical protein